MIDTETKRSENIQTMMTRAEKQRLATMAEHQDRTVSGLVRKLLLESLTAWEKSGKPARKKK